MWNCWERTDAFWFNMLPQLFMLSFSFAVLSVCEHVLQMSGKNILSESQIHGPVIFLWIICAVCVCGNVYECAIFVCIPVFYSWEQGSGRVPCKNSHDIFYRQYFPWYFARNTYPNQPKINYHLHFQSSAYLIYFFKKLIYKIIHTF